MKDLIIMAVTKNCRANGYRLFEDDLIIFNGSEIKKEDRFKITITGKNKDTDKFERLSTMMTKASYIELTNNDSIIAIERM